MKPSSSFQQQPPTQVLQPTSVVPLGSTSKIGMPSQFHWYHAVLAVGFLAASGCGAAVLFKVQFKFEAPLALFTLEIFVLNTWKFKLLWQYVISLLKSCSYIWSDLHHLFDISNLTCGIFVLEICCPQVQVLDS